MLPAHGFADDAHALLDRLDGLLFSGGPDLDPATYGAGARTRSSARTSTASPTSTSSRCSPPRTERDLPMLAICRGMQALNVARGGTLHQHLPDLTELEHRPGQAPYEPAHAVTSPPSSPLHRLTGRRRLHVNSFHHQAIDRLGDGLEVIARAPDGTVEAIHDPAARFCLGVQWHAELLTHRAEHAPMVTALIDAAAARRCKLVA